MKPKTFLSALSAVVLIGNASCALFTKSLNGSGVNANELSEQNEEKAAESIPAIIPFAVEKEAPIGIENLKSVHDLEVEQPVSRAQNGKFVFVKSIGRNCDIFTTSLEAEDEPRPMHINENYMIKDNYYSSILTFLMPKFSPDGSKIAFSRIDEDFSATIYTMDQDGQNLKIIAEGNYPCFTPDGQRIVASNNSNQVFTCDLNGGDKKILIPKNPNADRLDYISCINFTPDGNGIYFIQYNFKTLNNVLKIADAVTGEIIEIVNGIDRASFSPDGKYIVCVDSNREMCILMVEGGSIFEDLPAGRFNNVIWSPDGRNIFYSKSGYCGLYDIKFVDGKPILETSMERSICGAVDFAWQSLPI